jgi:prepilin-type processing-associated H-X9-DG protein
MYSNESRGELMPASGFHWAINPNVPRTDDANSDLGNIELLFSFRPNQMYPEYMPDPAILICPSDADNDLKDDHGPNLGCIALNDNHPCPGSGELDDGIEVGIMGDLDESYYYLGWTFDKFDNPQFLNDGLNEAMSIEDIINLIELLGDDPETFDLSAISGPTQFVQVYTHFLNDWVGDCLAFYLTDEFVKAQDCFNLATDRDWRPIIDPTNTAANYGNGDTDTVFRLREGIERFLITDINNPGASAKAQSNIFIMFDAVSTNVEGYNHIPGGSNVLYLDGHVQFIRYPGEAPVTRLVAELTGNLQVAL